MSMNLLEPPYPQLSSLVAPSATKLERCSAIIADKIFEAWSAFMFSGVKLLKEGLRWDEAMPMVREAIEDLCARRFHMREEEEFPTAMCNTIQECLDALRPVMSINPEANIALLWMYLLEIGMRLSLGPWFDLRLFKTYNYGPDTGRITVQLYSPSTGQPVAGTRCCLCTADMMRLEHAQIMRRAFDRGREDICSGNVLATRLSDADKKNWDYKLPYREIIESYDWEKAPTFKDYSLQPVPFESEVIVYESICRKMVENWSGDEFWGEDFMQLVEDQQSALDRHSRPISTEERALLKNFFDDLENLGMGKRPDLGPWLEEVAQWRKGEKPEPPGVEFKLEEFQDSEGTQYSYRLYEREQRSNPEQVLAEFYSSLSLG